MSKITVEKSALIQAFQKWNSDAINNPENFTSINGSENCAERQVDDLLSYLPVYHQHETAAEIRTEIVADFIEFCKQKGELISDTYFEEFFGA